MSCEGFNKIYSNFIVSSAALYLIINDLSRILKYFCFFFELLINL